MNDFWVKIFIKLIYDIFKNIILSVPHVINQYQFRKFFGIKGNSLIYGVVDPYSHPAPPTNNRFIKDFLGRKEIQPLIGESFVLGSNVIRVVDYMSSVLGRYEISRDKYKILLDVDCEKLWDSSFICFGSSDSNIKTYDIEQLPEQKYYTMPFGESGYREFNVGNKIFNVGQNTDYGVLLKLRNPKKHGTFLFVCAGLGGYGTSGTAYFLFTYWKEIYKKMKSKEFCKVIKVSNNSDQTAMEVLSISE